MKRLLHKLFPSFFQVNETRYIDVPKSGINNLQVSLINPENKSMHIGLGINQDRADQLTTMIRDAFIKHSNTVLAVSELGDELKHPNELFFVTMTIAVDISKFHSKQHNDKLVQFN